MRYNEVADIRSYFKWYQKVRWVVRTPEVEADGIDEAIRRNVA